MIEPLPLLASFHCFGPDHDCGPVCVAAWELKITACSALGLSSIKLGCFRSAEVTRSATGTPKAGAFALRTHQQPSLRPPTSRREPGFGDCGC